MKNDHTGRAVLRPETRIIINLRVTLISFTLLLIGRMRKLRRARRKTGTDSIVGQSPYRKIRCIPRMMTQRKK